MASVSRDISDPGLDEGEFLVDTSIILLSQPNEQTWSAVAFDGTSYLVVWQDWRRGEYDIYGARVTPQGNLLDPSGFLISVAGNWQYIPGVAFDGANYLVVWQDSSDIFGARVTPQGDVLDPEGISISTAANDQLRVAIASDGTNSLVVWQDGRSGIGADVYAARVSQSGAVLDPNGIPISTAGGGQGFPAACWGGVDFLVVWQDDRSGLFDIYGSRVTPAGTVLDQGGIPISTAPDWQEYPATTYDGTNFLVSWDDYRSGGCPDIYCARVKPDGTVLDPDGIPVSTAVDYQWCPAVAFDGTDFLVVWTDSRSGSSDVYGARVTCAGAVLDPDGIPVSTAAGSQCEPDVGFDGTNFLAVWVDRRSGGYTDIYCARIGQTGAVLDLGGILTSTEVAGEWSPAVSAGADYLVVWEGGRSGCWDIYGGRVTSSGSILDPDGIPISTEAYDQCSPALATDGTEFLVVWQDNRSGSWDIRGTRVTPGGVVMDTSGIPVSASTAMVQNPAVAFGGAEFLVVWQDYRRGHSDIYGARVAVQGAVLDSQGIAISHGTYSQWSPSVASSGPGYFVVWQDIHNRSWDIYGARVTAQGVSLDTSGVPIATAADDQEHPVVGFDRTYFLIAWEDYRDGEADIYGARVTPAGMVLDPEGIVISAAAGDQVSPAIAFDGDGLMVMWEDYRSGDGEIYAALVSSDGIVSDCGQVVSQRGDQRHPALAPSLGSGMFLVYQGWAGTVGDRTYNSDRIWGKMDPVPGVEEDHGRQGSVAGLGPTIVRGILSLPSGIDAVLLDVNGRRVMDLPGALASEASGATRQHDIRHIAPGVYFCRQTAGSASCESEASAVQKVIIQR